MGSDTANMLAFDRLHFAATVTFHYLFPQLTMGLALLIAVLRTRAYWWKHDECGRAATFWTRIFAVTFAFGVATGVPMEFQFGTNWAGFSEFAGGCIGQTLAMEGVFAFFLESSLLGVMLAGGARVGARTEWIATIAVWAGSWLSGYFILATNAWMQHPVAYTIARDGTTHLSSFFGLLGNPWLLWQYLHNQCAAVITGAFVISGVGAFYLLSAKHAEQAKVYLRTGLIVAAVACILQIFPTGDGEARQVFHHQPIKGAAMEGLFFSEQPAPMTIVGQPNMRTLEMDNPIKIPGMLSFLTYRRFNMEVRGLTAFPRGEWPDHVPSVYYAYHMMVGLGTIFLVITLGGLFLLWKGRLFTSRWALWIIMLAMPFPYISTTAGWVTAEVGRQPWVAHGLLRTADGLSPLVSSGTSLFTLLGFSGLYLLMGIAYVLLMFGLVGRGPETPDTRIEGPRRPQRRRTPTSSESLRQGLLDAPDVATFSEAPFSDDPAGPLPSPWGGACCDTEPL
jgi:cytochrome d ubiquinol oxidase subunit I